MVFDSLTRHVNSLFPDVITDILDGMMVAILSHCDAQFLGCHSSYLGQHIVGHDGSLMVTAFMVNVFFATQVRVMKPDGLSSLEV